MDAGSNHERRALVADEDRVRAGLIALHLRRAGVVTVVADSASAARDAVSWGTPDALVVALGGAAMDGLELAQDLAGSTTALFFVAGAGGPSLEEELEAWRVGAQGFLPEPITAAALRSALEGARPRPIGASGRADEIVESLEHRPLEQVWELCWRRRLNARLELDCPRGRGSVLLRGGAPIGAQFGDLTGRDAFFELAGIGHGRFRLVRLAASDPDLAGPDRMDIDLATALATALDDDPPTRPDPRAWTEPEGETEEVDGPDTRESSEPPAGVVIDLFAEGPPTVAQPAWSPPTMEQPFEPTPLSRELLEQLDTAAVELPVLATAPRAEPPTAATDRLDDALPTTDPGDGATWLDTESWSDDLEVPEVEVPELSPRPPSRRASRRAQVAQREPGPAPPEPAPLEPAPLEEVRAPSEEPFHADVGDLDLGDDDVFVSPVAAPERVRAVEQEEAGEAAESGHEPEEDAPADPGPLTRDLIAATLPGLRWRAWLVRGSVAALAAGFVALAGFVVWQVAARPSASTAPATGLVGAAEADAAERVAAVRQEERAVEQALTLEEEVREAYGEGVLAYRAGEVDVAARHFRHVLRRQGDHAGALAGLTAALIEGRSYDEARTLLDLLVRSRPDDPAIQLQLGLVAHRLDDIDVAREALDRFMELAPDNPNARDVERLQLALQQPER